MTSGIDKAAALAAIERCRRIEWRVDPARLHSTIALMWEYLRRSAVVAQAVGETRNWPWFDAAVRLSLPNVDRPFLPAYVFLDAKPPYERPGVDPLEDAVIALNQHFNAIPRGPDQFPPNYYGRHSCWWYIRWASVKNHPALAPPALPDPYEPLIVLYERGGSFHTEHGFIGIFSCSMMPQGTPAYWSTQEPLPSLAPAALDALDREGAAPERKI